MAITKGTSYKDVPGIKPTARTRAYEHALDIEFMVLERMNELNISKKDLAERMGVSPSGLSNLLNGQPNMTLETIAKFELALDSILEMTIEPNLAFQIEANQNKPLENNLVPFSRISSMHFDFSECFDSSNHATISTTTPKSFPINKGLAA